MNDYKLNFASKAVSAVSGFAVSVILARYLGVTLRGEFAFVLQTSGVLAIVFGLGFNQAFPYFFRQKPVGETYQKFVRLFIAQFLIYSTSAVVVCLVFQNRSVVCLSLLLVSTILYQQMEGAMAAYDIRLKIWTNIVAAVIRVSAHILMFLSLPSNLLWPTLISAGLWLAMSAAYLVRTGGLTGASVSVNYTRSVVRFSWLPMLSALLMVVNYNVDALMLKWLGSPTDLGNYAVASGIVIYIWMIPDAIKEVMVSRLVRSRDAKAVLLPLKAAIASGLLGLLVVGVTGSWAIPWLFGSDFSDAYSLCVILSIGVVSMIYFKILGTYLLADGRRGFYFGALAVSVALNVVANLFAIPAFGAQGAAWTCVASYSVTGVAFVVYFRRVSGLSWSDLLWIWPADVQGIRAKLVGGKRD